MDIKKNLKEGKKLLIISTLIILCISYILYLLLKVDIIKPFLEGVILLVGFTTTIYSVVLTILLFNFLSMSKAKFWLNSKQYVERNKEEIMEKVIALSNMVGQLVKNKKNDVTEGISDELLDHFHYIKTINDKYTNEQTALSQCKDTFKTLVESLEKSGLLTAKDIQEIELEKLNKIKGGLIELTVALDTIFNEKN
ncbi:hypothetical protein ACS2OW_26410 [Bacillus cereus group sp. BceL035]|uniref:hypothetical protein n=1 Tax=Bacillus cereus group TaxID=86661 RepID=UPI000BF67E82|nr:hypothetical protein [Bacillus tropicus]PET26527.1 hypothetical protein CN518_29155 [Bacillus anthracis]PGV32057.1 hypothetical protein COD75_24265 [Bacillus anthracis]